MTGSEKEITEKSVFALSQALQKKELSSLEITQAYFNQIRVREPDIQAYLTITEEKAVGQARASDRRRLQGAALSPLDGVPLAAKDNLCTKGIPTTCSSRMLESFVPSYDAAVLEMLYGAGAVLLGKLNMDEFAMGSTTESSCFQLTRNPHDLSRVPGGSSGGAAAAVAAGEAPFALGSDTGGSIRQPAAFCGVVGLKPTYGAVSRYGLVAFASSLDQIGPLTKTVQDAALVFEALAGRDPRDSTSLSRQWGDVSAEMKRGVKGLRLALPRELFENSVAPAVQRAVESAARQIEAMGAILVEPCLPSLRWALPAYYILSSAEASSNLARYDGIRYGHRSESAGDLDSLYKKSRSEGFGREVKRRILLGAFVLSSGYQKAYYKKALQVRAWMQRDFSRAFEQCDAILTPTAPTTAYRIGEKNSHPLQMYTDDLCTVPANLAGLPALSLPCGRDSDGLPIGMQLIGPAFSEPLLFRIGHAWEQGRNDSL